MAARRTKAELDPTILTRVVDIVAIGAGKAVAARQAGIAEETLRNYERIGAEAWAKREEAIRDEREPELDAREQLFSDFYDRLRRAESHTKAYALGLIQKAAKGDWKAAAWLLERLYPREFGRYAIPREEPAPPAPEPEEKPAPTGRVRLYEVG